MEDLTSVRVTKRDGSTEGFARTKIYNGVLNASNSADIAEGITLLIEAWIHENFGAESSVTTSDIRSKIISLLDPIAPEASKKFQEFKRSV